MYTTKQQKPQQSRTIKHSLRSISKQHCYPIQCQWKESSENVNILEWSELSTGIKWYYSANQYWFSIEDIDRIPDTFKQWYKYYENTKRTYIDWYKVLRGHRYLNDAASHTTGNYKLVNAAVSYLTKCRRLNQTPQRDDFLTLYCTISNRFVLEGEKDDIWESAKSAAENRIKAFESIGEGPQDLVGKIVNRGDSINILEALGISEIKEFNTGKTIYDKKITFYGITSTALGNDYKKNPFAEKAKVVWLLEIGQGHHGFDFKRLVNTGYAAEDEITFSMNTEVHISHVVINDQRYFIHGKIF